MTDHTPTGPEAQAAALRGATVRTIPMAAIKACRFLILLPEHYRDDGTCRCDDAAHRAKMVAEWEYQSEDFDGIPLRP